MHQLRADAVDMKQALLRGNIQEVADVLNRSWQAKRRTSGLVSNSTIEEIFDLGLKNGAVAGKVSGAGGGGFLMFMTDPEQRYRLIAGLNPPESALLQADAGPAKIQKSELAISEPRRHRDKTHLKFVASQPCLVCGRSPADAHHLRFTQPRAMGRKVSDEFTVPLCRVHHRDNHSSGDELAWWERRAIDPIATSRALWVSTRRIE